LSKLPTLDASECQYRRAEETKARDGQPLRVGVDTKRMHFFDADIGVAIHRDRQP
jgi:hypothetical protein